MKKLINHIRRWNIWRKGSLNSKIQKLFVLFGLIKSPTMCYILLPEEKIHPIFSTIDEVHEYPLPEMVTSEKPNIKIYYTFTRGCSKSTHRYEYIKAMLEAGYEFVPVEEREMYTTYLVRPREERTI